MRGWDAAHVASAAGATLVRGAPGSPARVVIDSRAVGPGDLFVGLPGVAGGRRDVRRRGARGRGVGRARGAVVGAVRATVRC